METVLIIGGSGYVGTKLTSLLQQKGYTVMWLTRSINPSIDITQYRWDWKQKKIEIEAIEKADIIINLSGANVGDKRWNETWKKEIYDSRVQATNFLFETIATHPNKIKTFVSASATGFYGCTTSEKIFTENDLPATDFLAKTCSDWETSVKKFAALGIKTCIIRTGVVFSENSEAFKKIVLPIRYGLGAAIGSGKQYFAWIHLDDLCNIYLKAIDDENMHGIYNAVAPQHISNKKLMQSLANHYKKPFWLPSIPAFIIKILFGEIAHSLLNGSRISADKITNAGFIFKYPTLLDL